MPRSAFSQIFQDTLINAGYSCAASVHGIRRQLGKKVDELYTEVQRSQHLTQADPRIFGQAYVANTSSLDGQGAFLGEATSHQHIDYFQGLDRFREPGLPCELPARREEELKQDQKLLELEAEIRQCPSECPTALKQSKQLLVSYWKRLKRIALYEHREQWIQMCRDHQILTRGRERSNDHDRTDLVQSLSLLFPERRRLARQPASDDALGSKECWLAMEDLYTLCTRDLSVLYLPGHQPVASRCPVAGCQSDLDRLPKAKRNQHINAYTRQEIVRQLDDHGLSRTVPRTLKNLKTWVTVPSFTEHEQEKRRKRKASGDNSELSWPQQKQLSSTHPPKKARRESLTIAPSLLSDLDTSTKGSTSSVDITASDLSIGTPEAFSPQPGREDDLCESKPESDLLQLAQSQGSDTTVIDPFKGDVFSQFIRSPLPDLTPTTVTADSKNQTTVDVDDLLTPVSTGSSHTSLLHYAPASKQSQSTFHETQSKLRIRLRVKPPEKTIKLRLTIPCKDPQSKQKCQPKSRQRKQGRRLNA